MNKVFIGRQVEVLIKCTYVTADGRERGSGKRQFNKGLIEDVYAVAAWQSITLSAPHVSLFCLPIGVSPLPFFPEYTIRFVNMYVCGPDRDAAGENGP